MIVNRGLPLDKLSIVKRKGKYSNLFSFINGVNSTVGESVSLEKCSPHLSLTVVPNTVFMFSHVPCKSHLSIHMPVLLNLWVHL